VADKLTRALAEAAADFLRRHEIDPPELATGGDLGNPLWTAVIDPARVTRREDLADAVHSLREIIDLAQAASPKDNGPLTEVGRISLVLWTIERLATDDLRRLSADDGG
jgi:hypothetical protein